uniref:Uncharacterized protein n=1 Tax=Arundo donax TaxID=35708 RepID=A0A0A8ZW64_ARUDO
MWRECQLGHGMQVPRAMIGQSVHCEVSQVTTAQ